MRGSISLSWLVRAPRLFCTLIASGGCGHATLVDRTFEVGPGTDGTVYDILVQEDGRIIVGGDFDELAGEPCPHLGRLTDDGHLEPSFSSGTDGTVYRLLEQPDGRILVAGEFDLLQGVARTNLGRLLTNGAADPTFDPGGLFLTNPSPFALASQPDGKVLVGTLTGSADARLFRLLPDGALDPSFIQTNRFEY